jgi:hypothetical protein
MTYKMGPGFDHDGCEDVGQHCQIVFVGQAVFIEEVVFVGEAFFIGEVVIVRDVVFFVSWIHL